MQASATPKAIPRGATRGAWIALSLLVISVCINYVDRGNLSVAGVALSKELHLSPSHLGWLLSAFFWTYASMQMVAGWLIDRYNVVWVYATGFAIWTIATVLTGVASTFVMLFALRLLLGVSESVAYPSYSKILAAGFPERQRGIANGLIDAGSKLGPALGLMIGGLILVHFGWRWIFLGIGLASMLWLIPWCIVAGGIKTASRSECKQAPSFRRIFAERDAWGTFIGLFCANYAWYFMLTWLPQYLIMERHYSTEMMAMLGSLPFWTVAAGAVVGGFAADHWIDAGGSTTVVRKSFTAGGLCLTALLLMPAAIIAGQTAAMAVLACASFAFGLFSANHWAVTQTLAGTLAAGKWTGIENCAGNIAGVVGPVVTGYVVEQTGSFYYAFVCVSVLALVGALAFLVIIRRVEEVDWCATP